MCSDCRDDPLSADTICRTMRRMELVPEGARCICEPLAGGVSSDIWKVAVGRERYCLKRALPRLKVAQLWEARVARNAVEWDGLVEITAATRRALVHGDVSPKNLLIGPHGPIFIDAECAWYGDPAFDPAFCLNHLLLKCLWRPQHAHAFLACFDRFAAIYLEG